MLIQAGGCAPAPLFQIRDAQVVRAGKTILHVGDFSLDEGEHVALLGPNGAGKTTVFNCITQFYKPTGGLIYYRNREDKVIVLNKYQVHDVIKTGIVRTFQNVEVIYELSILDNLLIAAHTPVSYTHLTLPTTSRV